jgi:hypothetical protein
METGICATLLYGHVANAAARNSKQVSHAQGSSTAKSQGLYDQSQSLFALFEQEKKEEQMSLLHSVSPATSINRAAGHLAGATASIEHAARSADTAAASTPLPLLLLLPLPLPAAPAAVPPMRAAVNALGAVVGLPRCDNC